MIGDTIQRSKGYSFHLKTSSGDEISLESFDSKESRLLKEAVTLREKYGLKFSYKGDGLDKQDLKEIDEAMKKIKPLLTILDPDKNFVVKDSNITNKAFDINSLLPEAKDTNHKNFIKDSLVDVLDEMLEAFDKTDKTIKLAKNLFDELEKQMEYFSFYA